MTEAKARQIVLAARPHGKPSYRLPSRGNRDPDAKCRAGSAAGPVSIARPLYARANR